MTLSIDTIFFVIALIVSISAIAHTGKHFAKSSRNTFDMTPVFVLLLNGFYVGATWIGYLVWKVIQLKWNL